MRRRWLCRERITSLAQLVQNPRVSQLDFVAPAAPGKWSFDDCVPDCHEPVARHGTSVPADSHPVDLIRTIHLYSHTSEEVREAIQLSLSSSQDVGLKWIRRSEFRSVLRWHGLRDHTIWLGGKFGLMIRTSAGYEKHIVRGFMRCIRTQTMFLRVTFQTSSPASHVKGGGYTAVCRRRLSCPC